MSVTAETSYDLIGFWARLKRATLTLGLPIAAAAILPITFTVLVTFSHEAWALLAASLTALVGWALYFTELRSHARRTIARATATPEPYMGDFLRPVAFSFGARDTKELEQTLAMCRAALREPKSGESFTRTLTLLDYGNALFDLGQLTGNPKHLEEAIEAFRSVLSDGANQSFPLNRAFVAVRFGQLLHTLGREILAADWRAHNIATRIRRATERIEEARNMYRLALREFGTEEAPRELIATLNRLGAASVDLWWLNRNSSHLREAIEFYSATEPLREYAPMEWAWAQFNLGRALLDLSTSTDDSNLRGRGLEAMDRAIEFFRENIRREVAAGYYLARATELRNAMTSQ
jgi:tetratricopeptide (TPR) repeat protein